MAVLDFRDLLVWQRGMDLLIDIYQFTKEFPRDERYGIVSQLRRASASIPANIAEGHSRDSTKDFLRHLSIAVGSLSEVETFIIAAERLGFGDRDEAPQLLSDCRELTRMMRSLQRSLKSRLSSSQ